MFERNCRHLAFDINIYKKRLLLRCIHHFKSDLIYNMDHMRISGIEPSSVIISQTKLFQKLKDDGQKVPKQTKAKRGGVLNLQNYNFNQFYTENCDALKTLRINRGRA